MKFTHFNFHLYGKLTLVWLFGHGPVIRAGGQQYGHCDTSVVGQVL
jgi:hypothetical protein